MTSKWVTQQLRNRARTLTQVSAWGPWPMGLASPQAKTLTILWKDQSLVLDGLETLGEQPLYTDLGWNASHRPGQGCIRSEKPWADWRPRGGRPSEHQKEKDDLRPWLLPWEWRVGSITSDLGSWPSLLPLRYWGAAVQGAVSTDPDDVIQESLLAGPGTCAALMITA